MANRVTVSMLFTDLVDSTAHSTQRSADDAELLRVAHFELLRRAISDHGGREVKNLGDGIMAAFGGTSSALDAAVAIQRAVAEHNATRPELPLAVRIGVATGDCVEEDGDYFGEPVVQAARLCAAAEGDQILAPEVLRLLAPRGEYDFADVGELALKGLPEPVSSMELRWSPLERRVAEVPLQDRLVHGGTDRFVGRTAELSALEHARKAAATGDRQIVLITGEAGLGKTALVSAVAGDAVDDGAVVLYGRCDEELAIPYRPWVELVSHAATHVSGAFDDLDPASRRELARLVPSLRAADDAPSGPRDAATGTGDQYLLFRAVTTLLESLCRDTTVVVVLDDLHWADRPSLQLLRHLAAATHTAAMVIVATYRDTDAGEALADASTQLHREPGVQRIALEGLSDLEVVSLLERTAGHEIDDDGVSLAHALRAETAGNPFFLTELLRHLADSGVLEQREDGRWVTTIDPHEVELPQSVRDLVRQRIRRLTEDALPTLSTAAVVGRDFDVQAVAAVLDVGEDQVLDVLEASMAARLVSEVPGEPDRFTFTHALVQHSLYQELSASRRARTHQRIAEAIEAIVGDDPGDRIGELANHWLAAVRPTEVDRVIDYSMRAGQRALDTSAPEEAVRWYREALEAVDADSPLRSTVLARLGEAERQAGEPVYRERLLDAARLARQRGEDEVLITAALANHRGFHSASGELDQERIDVLEAALERVPAHDPGLRARLLATLAGERTYGDDASPFDVGGEAMALTAGLGDDEARFDTIHRLGSSLSVPDHLDGRWDRAQEALRLTERLDDPFRRFFALEIAVDADLAVGDMVAARAHADERLEIATTLGQPILRWIATNGTALLDVVQGDVELAEQRAGEAFELGLETGQPDTMVYFGALIIQVRLHQGRAPELIPLVKDRVETSPGLPAFRAVLAWLYVLDGQIDEARAYYDGLVADRLPFPVDVVWLTGNVLAAEVASLLDHTGAARTLYDRLSPYAGHIAHTRTNCQGAVAHYLGLLARTLDRSEDARRHLEQALKIHDRLRAPWHAARSRVALADLVFEEEPARARTLASDALDLARQHGMPGIETKASGFVG